MHQTTLWHDTVYDALGTAVTVAGGPKKVGEKLHPAKDATTAASMVRGGLNPEHAQKFDPAEVLLIVKLAKERGDNSYMEFLARELGYEVKPLSPEDSKKRAKRARRMALLDELKRLEDE